MALDQAPIIKKVKKVAGHGHHGGAWKVAYADFVTAMMAFFLLMWLLNATSEEQRRGLSNYFGPLGTKEGAGGAGGVLGGLTIKSEGMFEDQSSSGDGSEQAPKKGGGDGKSEASAEIQQKAPGDQVEFRNPSQNTKKKIADIKDIQASIDKYETETFKEVKDSLKQAIEENPELKELSKNLVIDETPEGLRIQIVDQGKFAMFPSGDYKPYPHTMKLLEQVGKIIKKMPNKVSITGHTDANPYRGRVNYSNWELSSDRANAARRALWSYGVEGKQLFYISGKADTEPFLPNDPKSEQNRRISILLYRMKKEGKIATPVTKPAAVGVQQPLSVTKPAAVGVQQSPKKPPANAEKGEVHSEKTLVVPDRMAVSFSKPDQ
jgi:chemotaxis protein MotB